MLRYPFFTSKDLDSTFQQATTLPFHGLSYSAFTNIIQVLDIILKAKVRIHILCSSPNSSGGGCSSSSSSSCCCCCCIVVLLVVVIVVVVFVVVVVLLVVVIVVVV